MEDRIRGFLSNYRKEKDLEGLFFIGDSYCDLDMYYLSRFLAGDCFALLASDQLTLLVSSMEKGRASKESSADQVVSTSDYGAKEKLRALGTPEAAYLGVLRDFLKDHGIKRLGVLTSFPVGIYRALSEDFDVIPVESPVAGLRVVKSPSEIEAIKAAQRSCQASMKIAIDLIAASKPKGDILYSGDDVPLTSEKVRSAIEVALLEGGCEAMDTIVAGGDQAVDPHCRGSGPLPANSPIVLDIFPRSKSSRYFADMTRAVLKGEASPEVMEMFEAVTAAQDVGLAAVRAGVTGKEVHSRVAEVFKDRGYPETEGKGFTHSTGHGVGLEVHERPSLSESDEVLEANNVVTVEPGLYYPGIGGIRLEDLVVVTSRGCDDLTVFERRLQV
jgi:Xaa-Pro aminopeptidase